MKNTQYRLGGSSPRVWGQDRAVLVQYLDIGIIPTRMGTSKRSYQRYSRNKDHPHAYGDKSSTEASNALEVGSSPRVWGQDDIIDRNKNPVGIIPTRMGTSCRASENRERHRDHPHAYGDKTATAWHTPPKSGSSPRVWGQAVAKTQQTQSAGIIPTRMGTSDTN